MAQTIELPDGIEVEFPDEMSVEQMDLEIRRSFPHLRSNPMPRVPEPGGAVQMGGLPTPAIPQAFPIKETQAQANIAAQTPELSVEEAEKMLTTTHGGATIPEAVKYSSIGAALPQTREFVKPIADAGAALIEQSLATPVAPLLTLAGLVPGVREALGLTIAAGATKEAAKKAGEFSVTGDPRTAGEATASGIMGLGAGVMTGLGIAQSRPGAFARDLAEANRAGSVQPMSQAVYDNIAQKQLPAPRRNMPEFTESTLEPGGPPLKTLPAPGESGATAGLVGETPLGPRTAGYRITLPVEPETAKAARQVWDKVIDVEAEVEGASNLRKLVSLSDEVAEPGKEYKPPVVNVDLRQLEKMMKKNTVSTVEGWADNVIREKLGGASANPFMDPEFMAAAATKGAILFKRGVTEFAVWSAEMRKQFGPVLDSQLRPIFDQSKNYWEAKKAPTIDPQAVGAPSRPIADWLKDALKEREKQGWNPKWPFVPADLMNKGFRDAILSDPTIKLADKKTIMSFGGPEAIEEFNAYASKNPKTAPVHGNVLRDAQTGQSAQGMPVNEGQSGVRTETEAQTLTSPIRENGGRTSLVLPDGTAIVGGRIHAQTYDAALRLGKATDEQLQSSISAFTRPDGTSWDLQGKPVKVTRVVNLSEGEPPSPQSLGIAGPGAAAMEKIMQKAHDIFVPRQQGTPPPLAIDTGTNFPDFSPIPVANANFARTFGIGRVPVLGWLFDPNQRVHLPFQESIQRYFSERYDVARAQSSAVGEMIRGQIDKEFNINSKGEITNIGAPEGASRFWGDVFEAQEANPGTYTFTPEQTAALNRWLSLKAEAQPLLRKYKLAPTLSDDEALPFDQMTLDLSEGEPVARPYAPRIVRERPSEFAKVGGGGGVGSKAFFEKSRMFDTMQEGYDKGVRYETSPESSIATWVERVYKRIADKRLADDPNIGAIPVSEKKAELLSYYADDVANGLKTAEQVEKIAQSVIANGRVNQPAFAGKFVEPEIAQAVSRAFPNSEHLFRRSIATVNGAVKALKMGFDFGAPFIQGLPTFFKSFTSPKDAKAWALGAANMVRAFGSEEATGAWARQNIGAIRELAAYGSSVGHLNEMVGGIGKGSALQNKIFSGGKRLSEAGYPIAGKPLEVAGRGMAAFARSFETFLDVTKVELWKAYREITPKEQWGDVIRGIESQMLTARMRGIGVKPGQALLEEVALLAASYVRGSINLVGGALSQPGISGATMRKAMGSMLLAGGTLYYGIAKSLGMSDDDIIKRLNPGSPEFAMWKVKVGERYLNIGFGGIYRSYIRLAGNVVKQLEEDPARWHLPFVRWYRAHAGPAISASWDIATGKDFMGEEISVAEVAKRAITPLPLSQFTEVKKRDDAVGAPIDFAASIAGFTSFPQTVQKQFADDRNRMARERYGKKYEDLKLREQFGLNVELKNQALYQERRPQTSSQQEAMLKAERKRSETILSQMPDAVQERLDVLRVQLPSYDPTLNLKGKSMRFTEAQESAYQNLIVEEYTKVLPEILNNPKMDELTVAQRQQVVSEIASRLKERAKLRLISVLDVGKP